MIIFLCSNNEANFMHLSNAEMDVFGLCVKSFLFSNHLSNSQVCQLWRMQSHRVLFLRCNLICSFQIKNEAIERKLYLHLNTLVSCLFLTKSDFQVTLCARNGKVSSNLRRS